MRTTLVIPDPVYENARRRAHELGANLSQFVTEALTRRLAQLEEIPGHGPSALVIVPLPMGKPAVDLANRNELERAMED